METQSWRKDSSFPLWAGEAAGRAFSPAHYPPLRLHPLPSLSKMHSPKKAEDQGLYFLGKILLTLEPVTTEQVSLRTGDAAGKRGPLTGQCPGPRGVPEELRVTRGCGGGQPLQAELLSPTQCWTQVPQDPRVNTQGETG